MVPVTTLAAVPRVLSAAEQIAEHYRVRIRSGQLKAGDQLLTNRDLADDWSVSTATALRATNALRDEGWIVTRPAKPPTVSERHPK